MAVARMVGRAARLASDRNKQQTNSTENKGLRCFVLGHQCLDTRGHGHDINLRPKGAKQAHRLWLPEATSGSGDVVREVLNSSTNNPGSRNQCFTGYLVTGSLVTGLLVALQFRLASIPFSCVVCPLIHYFVHQLF